jgi:cell division protein FtsW
VVLSSAGGPVGLRLHGDNCYFVKQQAKWLALSLPLFAGAVFFDYHKWREHPWLTVLLYVGVVAMLLAVFGFREINGSRRWIILGPVRIQPSEFAKVALVIVTSVFLDKVKWRIELLGKGTIRALALIGLPMGLALCEPDFGATMVLALTGGMLLFIGGMRILHIASLIGICIFGVGSLLISNANRMRDVSLRMGKEAFLIDSPEELPDLSGFNHIGLGAGASTPDEAVRNVLQRLLELGYTLL